MGLWLGFFREDLAALVSCRIDTAVAVSELAARLLLIGLCLIFVMLTVLVLRRTEALQRSVERYYSDLAERASDTLGNIALVQSFTAWRTKSGTCAMWSTSLLGAQIRCCPGGPSSRLLTRASTTLTMLAILIVGHRPILAGQTTVGEIVMFMSFAGMLIQQLERAAKFANRFHGCPTARGILRHTRHRPGARRIASGAVTLEECHGEVEFDAVTLLYDGKRPAVADLSFTAEPGEIIALVGATGAGKSTALALLHRVYDPQSGAVKIDGRDIRGVKLASLRRNIGVVFQEPLLFNRSIAENLRVGNPDATEEEICRPRARARRSTSSSVRAGLTP